MDGLDCTQVIQQHFSDSDDEESGHLDRKSVAYLKLLSDQPLSDSTYSLFVGKNYVGRGESCDICINSQTLSKQHAVIEIDRKAKHFEVYDLGSSNKTKKGKIVLKPNVRYSLEHGTSIFFADVEFLFQIGSNKVIMEIDDVSSETGSESMFVANSFSSQSSPEKNSFITPYKHDKSNEQTSFNTDLSSSSVPEKRQLFCSPLSDESPARPDVHRTVVEETPAAALLQSRLSLIADTHSTIKDHLTPGHSPSEQMFRESKYPISSISSRAKSPENLGSKFDKVRDNSYKSDKDLFEAETQPYEDLPPTQLYMSQAEKKVDLKRGVTSPKAETQQYVDDKKTVLAKTEKVEKPGKAKSQPDLGIATQLYVPSDDEDEEDTNTGAHLLPETQLYVPSSPEPDEVPDQRNSKEDEKSKYIENDANEGNVNHSSNEVAQADPETKLASANSVAKQQDSNADKDEKKEAGIEEKKLANNDESNVPEKKTRSLSRSRKRIPVKRQEHGKDSPAQCKDDDKLSKNAVPVVVCTDVALSEMNSKKKDKCPSRLDDIRPPEPPEEPEPTVGKTKLRTRKRAADGKPPQIPPEPVKQLKIESEVDNAKSSPGRRKRERKTPLLSLSSSSKEAVTEAESSPFLRGRRKTNNSQSSEISMFGVEEKGDAEEEEIFPEKLTKSNVKNKNSFKDEPEASPKHKTKRTNKQAKTTLVSAEDDANTESAPIDASPAALLAKRTTRWKNNVEAVPEAENSPKPKRGKTAKEELRVDPLVLVLNKSAAGCSPYSIQKGKRTQRVDEQPNNSKDEDWAAATKIIPDDVESSTKGKRLQKKTSSSRKKKLVNYAEDNDSSVQMDENENLKELQNNDAGETPKETEQKDEEPKKSTPKRKRTASSSKQKSKKKDVVVEDSADEDSDGDEPLGNLLARKKLAAKLPDVPAVDDQNTTTTPTRMRRLRNQVKTPEANNAAGNLSEDKAQNAPSNRRTRSGRGQTRKKAFEPDDQEAVDSDCPLLGKEKTPTLSLRQFRKKGAKSDNSSEGCDGSLNESRTSITPARMFDSRVDDDDEDDDDDDDDLPLQESVRKRSTSRSQKGQKRKSEASSAKTSSKSSACRGKKSEAEESPSVADDEGSKPPRKTPKKQTKEKKTKGKEGTLKNTQVNSPVNDVDITSSSENGAAPSRQKKGRPKKAQSLSKPETAELNIMSPDKFNCYLSADPCISFTGVNDQQVEKIVKELGGKLTDTISECTHLVTDKVRRTCKFLSQVARGRPIVTLDWLHRCKKDKKFADASSYTVADLAAEKQYGFKLHESLIKASNKPLLRDYSIHVTPGVKPEPSQMKSIIECAGGQFLSRMPASNVADRKTIVVSCTEDLRNCSRALAGSVPVVSAEFILTGILQQSDDIESYCLIT